MKHTPGPWAVANEIEVHDRAAKRDAHGARIGDTPNCICKVKYPYADPAGVMANARLIAAAPELLETCIALIGILTPKQYSKQFPNIYRKARAAIAKAEGRDEA